MIRHTEIQGYLFISEGYEHGPAIMMRTIEKGWNQAEYVALAGASFCGNDFVTGYGLMDSLNMSEDELQSKIPWATKFIPKLEPGKKYRLVIEEIE